jgi:hypothetical protein
MTTTLPIKWPDVELDAHTERIWLRALAEQIAKRLETDRPPEMISGVLTARRVSRRDIQDEILESAEWETELDGRPLAVHARCAVREEWAAADGNEGGWRRIWLRLTAKPAGDGDQTDTTLTIEEA